MARVESTAPEKGYMILEAVAFALLFCVFIAVMRASHPVNSGETAPLVTTNSSDSVKHSSQLGERAFVIAQHPEHGFLILYAFKKRKGGRVGQLPGGRVDLGEHRLNAALRELGEETGMHIEESRLQPLPPQGSKFFYYLQLHDSDQVQAGSDLPTSGEPFKLKLSTEHNEFAFVKDANTAAWDLVKHSGGDSARAMKEYADTLV